MRHTHRHAPSLSLRTVTLALIVASTIQLTGGPRAVHGYAPAASCPTCTLGMVSTDFQPLYYPLVTAVGTGMAFNVERLFVQEDVHAPQVWQFTELNNGSHGQGVFNVAGWLTDGQTGYGTRTNVKAYHYISRGTGNPFVEFYFTFPVRWEESPKFTSSMVLKHENACTTGDCDNKTYVVWQHMYSAKNKHQTMNIKLFKTEPYPVKVREAYHGLGSIGTSDHDDVHISTSNHHYFDAPVCEEVGCSGPWRSDNEEPWNEPYGVYEPWPAEIDVYQPSGAADDGPWDMCLGKCPITPCGCQECSFPALSPNERWEPDVVQPVPFTIVSGFGSDYSLWKAAALSAAAQWNSWLGFKALKWVGSGSEHNIGLHGLDPWVGSHAIGSTYEKYTPVTYTGWDCPPGGPTSYRELYEANIYFNLQDYNWRSGCNLTTADYSPDHKAIMPMQVIILHEFGHALGLYSNSIHSGPCPSCPSYPATHFHALCSPMPSADYNEVPIITEITAPYVEALQCLFFHR